MKRIALGVLFGFVLGFGSTVVVSLALGGEGLPKPLKSACAYYTYTTTSVYSHRTIPVCVRLTSTSAQIIKTLDLTPMSVTQLGQKLKIDNGELKAHLTNGLLMQGLVEIVAGAGVEPVWGLTDRGRHLRVQLGSR